MNSNYYSSSDSEDENHEEQDKIQEGNAPERQTEFNAPFPGEHKHILYKPTFKEEMIAFAKNQEQIYKVHKQFLGKDWLTVDLSKEIFSLTPKEANINRSIGKRNGETFKAACLSLFPVGRMFSLYIQISTNCS